jgi:hypothetical protein
MPEKTLWITDVTGNKAAIEAPEFNTWKVRGWFETKAPELGDKVWLQHEVTGGKQLFDKDVVETWGVLGWKPCPPPEPVDLTKDQNLTDVPPDKPEPEPAKPVKSASAAKKEQ